MRLVAMGAVACALWLGSAALPQAAQASQLITRNSSSETLKVGRDGKAVVTYHAGGRRHKILVWGAVNGLPPTRSRRQVSFQMDYSGGWGRFRKPLWKTMKNACGPYRGPALPWLVTACTAPDGSHWALQRWQRFQANYGLPPWRDGHGAYELRISHWTGEPAVIEAWTDWYYSGKWHHLFGRLTYQGKPVYGFQTTLTGDPTDTYGRVLYVDSYNSALGRGWKRENGFVAKRPDGTFCYGFVPHTTHTGERRPAAHGQKYRLSTSGPGVSPDVSWEGPGLHDFRVGHAGDIAHEAAMNRLQLEYARRSKPCHP
jgi:hypothetical protein